MGVQPVAPFFTQFGLHFSSIGANSDHCDASALQQPEEIRVFPGKNLLFGLVLSLGLLACNDDDPAEPPAQSALPAPTVNLAACHSDAKLKLQFTGAIEGDLDWSGDHFQCESMRRPDDAGARLRFVGNADDATLALIIAIPGLERGATGKELASNLTMHVQDTALFFGTQGTESCWADIVTQDLLDGDRYDIQGEVYCIAPLGEINGDSSVTIVTLSFATQLDWDLT